MKRFLKDELNLELHALLEEKYYKIFSVIQVPDIREVISISDRIDATVVHRNPIWIIQAYVVLEKQLSELNNILYGPKERTPRSVMQELVKSRKVTDSDLTKFEGLRNIRNKYVHSTASIGGDDVEHFLKFALELSEKLKNLQ